MNGRKRAAAANCRHEKKNSRTNERRRQRVFVLVGKGSEKENTKQKKFIVNSFLHSQLSIEFDDLINKNIDR